MTTDERAAVLQALDLLGSALGDHAHQWTDEERAAYERAVALLGAEA